MRDKCIIKDCIKGKSVAREELYKIYAPKLFAVCLRYSKDYSEAEDILQDSFIKIFSALPSFKFKGSFEGWLRKITVNTSLERYRDNKKMCISEIEMDVLIDEDQDVSYTDIPMDVLLSMVQGLSERYRMVFNLYVLDGYSHKQIASEMNVSVGTSKSNLARARSILKTRVLNHLTAVDSKSNSIIC